MNLNELFEEIPVASGMINPATGKAWLPSELDAADEAEQMAQQAQAAAAEQTAKAALAANVAKYPTSSTAPAPSAMTYKGMLAPKPKPKPANFTQTAGAAYKMPGTPTVPTVPNMTKSPGKPMPAKAEPGASAFRDMSAHLITAPTSTPPASTPTATPTPGYQRIPKATIPTANTGMQDIINRLTGQIRTIKNKDDLKKIKQNIDREFTRKGVVTESAFIKRDILVKRANAKLARILK